MGEGRGKGKKISSLKKYLRRNSSQVYQCNDFAESSNDESSDEGDDRTTSKMFKIPWIELTEKCGDWVQCSICDDMSAQSAMTRDIFP